LLQSARRRWGADARASPPALTYLLPPALTYHTGDRRPPLHAPHARRFPLGQGGCQTPLAGRRGRPTSLSHPARRRWPASSWALAGPGGARNSW
jgi:hypothetical protein